MLMFHFEEFLYIYIYICFFSLISPSDRPFLGLPCSLGNTFLFLTLHTDAVGSLNTPLWVGYIGMGEERKKLQVLT